MYQLCSEHPPPEATWSGAIKPPFAPSRLMAATLLQLQSCINSALDTLPPKQLGVVPLSHLLQCTHLSCCSAPVFPACLHLLYVCLPLAGVCCDHHCVNPCGVSMLRTASFVEPLQQSGTSFYTSKVQCSHIVSHAACRIPTQLALLSTSQSWPLDAPHCKHTCQSTCVSTGPLPNVQPVQISNKCCPSSQGRLCQSSYLAFAAVDEACAGHVRWPRFDPNFCMLAATDRALRDT